MKVSRMAKQQKPDPAQLDLLADRRLMYELMQDSVFDYPAQKLVLLEIFLHIGKYERVRLALDVLGLKCGRLSDKSVSRIKNQLQAMGLIVARQVGSGVFEWSIGWANLWERHQEWKRSGGEIAVSEPAPARVGHLTSETAHLTGEMVHLMGKTADLTGKTDDLTSETAHLTGEMHIRNIVLNSSSLSSSSSSERDEVMLLVKNAGVGQFGHTVETALSQGMTTEQIAAVVAHYQAFPGRWEPGILRERLIRVGAHLLAADEGWYGDEAWHTAQQQAAVASQSATQAAVVAQVAAQQQADQRERETLQQAHGDTLGTMSREQLLQLAATHPDPTTADRVRRAVLHGFAAAVQLDLLRLLDSQKGQP